MRLSLVPESESGADPDEAGEVGEAPADQPPHDPIGKLGRQSFYAPMGSMNAAKAEVARWAVVNRYAMWEVLGAMFDAMAENPDQFADYLLKYNKARRQKAESEVS